MTAFRTGAKDLASSSAYPQDFGDKVAELHDELVPWMDHSTGFLSSPFEGLSSKAKVRPKLYNLMTNREFGPGAFGIRIGLEISWPFRAKFKEC